MEITEITHDKKSFLDLLLMGDEQESMIDRYLECGKMFALSEEGSVRAVCVMTDEGDRVLEIKNIAVAPGYRRMGYGKALISFIERKYGGSFGILRVGTGDSPLTVPFYEKCGFHISYRIKDFFTDNYDHPIYECGTVLRDMVYLEKSLDTKA